MTGVANTLQQIWARLTGRRKLQIGFALLLMIFSSLAEVLSLGLLIPFLAVMTSPDLIFKYAYVRAVAAELNIGRSVDDLRLFLTVAFCCGALFSGFLRILQTYYQTNLNFIIGSELSVQMYQSVLHQPYSYFLRTSSSEIISAVTSKAMHFVTSLVSPVFGIFNSGVMLVAIVSALVLLNPIVAFVSFFGFILLYFAIFKIVKSKISECSMRMSRESTNVVKLLQEGLGGIRDVLLDGAQDVYIKSYSNSEKLLREASVNNHVYSVSPRYAIESIAIVILTAAAFTFARKNSEVTTVVPIIGTFALGMMRLLPVIQQAYLSIMAIQLGRQSVKDAMAILNLPEDNEISKKKVENINFENNIAFKDIHFRYSSDNKDWVLQSLNYVIKKGSSVGIVGKTAGGKSTFVDLLMGLLVAEEGVIEIDGVPLTYSNVKSWQKRIAHVPQSIFLSEGTIGENIAFGSKPDDIDLAKVKNAAKKAQIDSDIEGLADAYNTLVGERGVRLSGGQRQRIGLARAFYKSADILILDEATSALDDDTERRIMNSIIEMSRNLTVIIIAHRINTLKDCDNIIEISEGKLEHIGKIADLYRRTEKTG